MIPACAPLRLVLELTPEREPIEGSIRLGPDEPLDFKGWIELVAALESVLDRRGAASSDDRPNEGAEED